MVFGGRNCVLCSMRAVNVAQRKSKFESIIWGVLKPLPQTSEGSFSDLKEDSKLLP